MALPFVNDELAEYNNLPAIPPTQPLGNILNQLYAAVLAVGAPNFVVFRPGGVAGANVAITWAQVETFLTANPDVPITIFLDGSLAACTVPGTADTDLEGRVTIASYLYSTISASATLTVADGGIIRNIGEIIACTIQGAPTAQPFIVLDMPFPVVSLRFKSSINLQAGATAAAMDILVAANFGEINLTEDSTLDSSAGGAQEVISMPNNGNLRLVCTDNTGGPGHIAATAIGGNAGSSLTNAYDASGKMDTQTLFLGTVTLFPFDYAANCFPAAGPTASRPANPLPGQMYFDENALVPIWWCDLLSQWQDANAFPA